MAEKRKRLRKVSSWVSDTKKELERRKKLCPYWYKGGLCMAAPCAHYSDTPCDGDCDWMKNFDNQ